MYVLNLVEAKTIEKERMFSRVALLGLEQAKL